MCICLENATSDGVFLRVTEGHVVPVREHESVANHFPDSAFDGSQNQTPCYLSRANDGFDGEINLRHGLERDPQPVRRRGFEFYKQMPLQAFAQARKQNVDLPDSKPLSKINLHDSCDLESEVSAVFHVHFQDEFTIQGKLAQLRVDKRWGGASHVYSANFDVLDETGLRHTCQLL